MLLRVEPHGLFSWLFLDSSHLLPFSLSIPLFLLSPTSSTSSSARLSLIRSGINSSTTSLRNSWARPDRIVPFTVEGVWQNGECCHLFIGDLASGAVGIGVELALHCQACLSRSGSDQLQDHRVACERFAAPVLADPGKEAMLNLVPFARSRRQVANRDREVGLIRQLLQFPFPYAHTAAVAASSICTDEQLLRRRILL